MGRRNSDERAPSRDEGPACTRCGGTGSVTDYGRLWRDTGLGLACLMASAGAMWLGLCLGSKGGVARVVIGLLTAIGSLVCILCSWRERHVPCSCTAHERKRQLGRSVSVMTARANPDEAPEAELLNSCPACGYRLLGLPVQHSCPECGLEFDRRWQVFGDWSLGREPWVLAVKSAFSVLAVGFALLGLAAPVLPGLADLSLLAIPLLALWWLFSGRPAAFIAAGPEGLCIWRRRRLERYPWAVVGRACLAPRKWSRRPEWLVIEAEGKQVRVPIGDFICGTGYELAKRCVCAINRHSAVQKYPPGTIIKGVVRDLASWGAFVEIEEGVDALMHISEMSRTKKIRHASDVVKRGDLVRCVVLTVDSEKARIGLGLREVLEEPQLGGDAVHERH
jgi:predicted RNA-binding protein with RPS1 domain